MFGGNEEYTQFVRKSQGMDSLEDLGVDQILEK
jgi:hypothetical protein